MSRAVGRLLILGVFALVSARAAAAGAFDFASAPGRLPKDVRPIEHVLQLDPDVAARRFRGHQSVRIEVLAPTRRIVMNGEQVTVENATLRGPGLARLALGSPIVDAERQQLRFELPRVLRPGRYTLEMSWSGVLNDTPDGLYLETYPTAGDRRGLIATDTEPAGARRILPCWDEPAFRTRFRLSIVLPAGWSVTSNMPPAASAALPGGGTRVAFAATPPMSSYLLTLVAGQTERVDDEVEGIRLGIVTTAGKTNKTGYAMAATKQLLPYYNDYFGQRYPLPKLDQIALPGGFGGAMEYWGAITYTESSLLVDPARTPERARKDAFGTIAHEVAHQWFGNLVTMGWWDDLWLNEAFAEWMSQKASDRFLPEWRIPLAVIAGRERAMELDARATTHPIRQQIENEAEAAGAFDAITYEKGAAFLGMTEAWLGEVKFRDGIRLYMAKHRYGSTTGVDLWASLDAASRQPVAAFAARWTNQPGFPLVDVDARCEAGRRIVSLGQSVFGSEPRGDAAPLRWPIPVKLQAGSASASTLLTGAVGSLELNGCDGPLLVDPDNAGFYRVRYAPPLFAALAAAYPSLPDAARLKLLVDTSALVRTDRAPFADWLALLPGLREEPRAAVWAGLIEDLTRWDQLLDDAPSHAAMSRFATALLRPRLDQLGWDERPGETVEQRAQRSQILQALVRFDDPDTLAEAKVRFQRYLADRDSLPTALLEPVLLGAGRSADEATWLAMKTLAEQSLSTEEKARWYFALGRVRDPALSERALQLALAPEVPQLSRLGMPRTVAGSGRLSEAWAFARAHAKALLADVKQYDEARYLGDIVRLSASTTVADELEAFVEAELPEAAMADARRTADEIRTRARLKERLQRALEAALRPS